MYCTGVVHLQRGMHAWHFEHIVDRKFKAWQPITTHLCKIRSVTSGLGSVHLWTASASWCWINGCNASTPWSLKSHMITLVIVHDFIFHLSMMSLTHFEELATIKMAGLATAARARDSKHQSNHRRTESAAGSQINVTLQINFKLICWGLNLHRKVWYKSEKSFGLGSEWHYTTRELVYGYSPWRARDYIYIHLPRCVMPFGSQAHAFSLYKRTLSVMGMCINYLYNSIVKKR